MNRQIRLLKSVSFIEAQLRAEGKASMPNDEPGLASDVYETSHARYRDYDLKMPKAENGNAVTFCLSTNSALDGDQLPFRTRARYLKSPPCS